MKTKTTTTISLVLFFLFILLTIYCFGAGMMDYFGMYAVMQEVGEKEFPAFHHVLGDRVIPIFVLPSAIMTLLNIAVLIFPPHFVNRKLLWLSLISYSFDWIFSFTMQIPIQLKLGEGKDMGLIEELLRTNWWRFGADAIQFIIVCMILWKCLRKLKVQAS